MPFESGTGATPSVIMQGSGRGNTQFDRWAYDQITKHGKSIVSIGRVVDMLFRYCAVELYNECATPSGMVNLGASTVAPTVDATAADWPGSLLFAGAADNDIGGVVKLPYRWEVASKLSPRIHVARTSNSMNAMTWNLRWRAASPVAGSWSAWSAPIAGTVLTIDPGGPDLTMVYTFGELDMTGFGLGTLLAWRLERIGSTDAYADPCRFFALDFTFLRDYDGASGVTSK